MKVLGILPNPHGWIDLNVVPGGFVRMIEVFNRWVKQVVSVETIESWPLEVQ